MTSPFAPLLRALAAGALACSIPLAAFAAAAPETPPPSDEGTIPAGGHFKECHGYVRHVSDLNIRVHCIDGNASDQSFLYVPRYTKLRDGKSIQTKDLAPDTPVHIYYTQSIGIKKAYMIYVADPQGNGAYGFRS
jgi:hypothetical protein